MNPNLDELRALLERATPGPWSFEAKLARGPARYVAPHDMGGFVDASGNIVCDFGNAEQYYPVQGTPPSADDAALIVWLRNNAAALLTLAEAGLGAGWRPIEEAPRDGTPILVARAGEDEIEITEWCSMPVWHFEHVEGDLYRKVQDEPREFWNGNGHRATHFMPLPAPPEEPDHA